MDKLVEELEKSVKKGYLVIKSAEIDRFESSFRIEIKGNIDYVLKIVRLSRETSVTGL